MKPGLSGYTIVRNAVDLDYCVELAIRSMSAVCNEIVVCDSDSTDGTMELLEKMAQEPEFKGRLRIVHYDWPSPKGDNKFLVTWMDHARQFLEYDMQLYLDADEVLHPKANQTIRAFTQQKQASLWFTRHNFWKDAWHLVPEGHCCGSRVVRFGPTSLPMCSDEIYDPGQEPEIRLRAHTSVAHRLPVCHYGFLRHPKSFFAKSKVVLPALLGSYDDRLVRAEADQSKPWHEHAPFPIPLLDYHGTHPKIAHEWLRERGYDPERKV